ncbi:MAG: stalk domain-containing protein [Bacillota bacterium]
MVKFLHKFSTLIVILLLALFAHPVLAFTGNGENQEVIQLQLELPSPNRAGLAMVMTKEEAVVPGVIYRTFLGRNREAQPLAAHVLELDVKGHRVELRPGLAAGPLGARESLVQMTQRHRAVASVNGGFFATGGGQSLPVGSLVVDGQVVSQGPILRSSVSITRMGDLVMGYFQGSMEILIPSLDLGWQVAEVNRTPGSDPVFYTSAWGPSTGTAPGALEIMIKPSSEGVGRITGVSRDGNALIPPGGFVLALPGASQQEQELLGQKGAGTQILINHRFDPWWQGLDHLLTGGPLLVEKGQPVFQAEAEGFTGTILARNPRTAVGQTTNGRILLVVVDGRQPEYSVGVTLEELAYLLVDLGCAQALALDGGGSSQMVVSGSTVNKPSENRTVVNGLMVFSHPHLPVWLDGAPLTFDVAPRIEQGRTLVPLRGILEALGATVIWDQANWQVLAFGRGREVVLKVDTREALVNGVVYTLDVPARIVDGRVLVPLRFVGEALGNRVDWQPQPARITISSPEVPPTVRPAQTLTPDPGLPGKQLPGYTVLNVSRRRVAWELREPDLTAHPNFTAGLPEGNLLTVRNSHSSPSVVELTPEGQVVWWYGPVAANSAVRLPNGNTLIAESGAPGYPALPQVIEVDQDKKIVWSFQLSSRAEAPRYAERLPGGDTLITTASRVFQVNSRGQVTWQYGGLLTMAVQATRLPNGNTLIIDQGISSGGRALEVDSQSRTVWQYGDGTFGGLPGQLRRPTAGIRLPGGGFRIADPASGQVAELNSRGEFQAFTGLEDVLAPLPVMSRWFAMPLTDGSTLIALSYTNGRSAIQLIDGASVKSFFNGQWFHTGTWPVAVNGGALAPAREWAAALGAEVHWDSESQTITITGRRHFSTVMGQTAGLLDGRPVELEVPAQLLNGRAMVPAKELVLAAGGEADWDKETLTLNIRLPQ